MEKDTYSKLLDLAVNSINRSSEGVSWIRRATKDSMVVNGKESPIPHGRFKLLCPFVALMTCSDSSIGR